MSSEHGKRHLSTGEPDASARADMTAFAEAVAFQRDLYMLWSATARSRALPLTSRGYVARPTLRRLRAELAAAGGGGVDEGSLDWTEPEVPRLLFLRRLGQRLGLLIEKEGKLVASDRHVMARYLAHPLPERVRMCVRVWSAGGWWPDTPDPRAAPPRLMSPAPPRVALARRRLLDSLLRVPAGESGVLPAQHSTRDVARTANGRSRVGGQRTPTRGPVDVEDVTQRAALVGPLAWLGLVEVPAETDSARLIRYRRGALVDALDEGGTLLAHAERPGRIVVQANFDIVAYAPLTASALLLLDTCAERQALDVTARYRLTRSSVAAARGADWTAADIAVRLEAVCGHPLPANVRTTLEDWERHVERVRLTAGVTLLEVREAAVLDALLADPVAARWVSRRLTATAALLADESAGAVRAWLLRRGELPAVREAGRGAGADDGAQGEANG